MYKNRDTHRSYKEFRDLDPVTARVIRSIEKVKDQDDPDRVAIKEHAIGRTVTRMRADLGAAEPEGKEGVL